MFTCISQLNIFFKIRFSSPKIYFSKREILYLDLYLYQIYLSIFRGMDSPISNFTDFYQNKLQPKELVAILKHHLPKSKAITKPISKGYLTYANNTLLFVTFRIAYCIMYWRTGKYFLTLDEIATACVILDKYQILLDSENPNWRDFDGLGVDVINLSIFLRPKIRCYNSDKSDIMITHLFENPIFKTMEIDDLLDYYLKK